MVAWGIFAFGGFYWLVWAKLLPRWGHYRLESKEVLGDDGFWRMQIIKVPESEVGDDSIDSSDGENINSNDIEVLDYQESKESHKISHE